MKNYRSAHRSLTIDNYPMGRNKRGVANYMVEVKKGKERANRITICDGKTSKPKTTTYGAKVAFLVCDEGFTWVATVSEYGEMISILKSNMQHSEETIHASSEPERYEMIKNMIDNAT